MHVPEPFSGRQQVLIACAYHLDQHDLDQHDLQKDQVRELEYKEMTRNAIQTYTL